MVGLVKGIKQRELRQENLGEFERCSLSNRDFVDAMQHSKTLEGHEGCVNTISWNRSGSLLASGSDDRNIMLWGADGGCVTKIRTEHHNNIFSVVFVSDSNDRMVLSASADRSVLLHDFDHLHGVQSSSVQRWECENRVKRLCTAHAFPKLFWSAAEDGILRQYDLRSNKAEKLVDLSGSYQLKSLAINEIYPEMIALALNDSMVPIYDRRYTKDPLLRLLPGHLSLHSEEERRSLKSCLVTHVAFNTSGDEIITNIGSDNIYVFNVRKAESNPDVLRALKGFLADNAISQDSPISVSDDSLFRSILKQAKAYAKEKEYTKGIDLCSTAMNVYLKENRLPRIPFIFAKNGESIKSALGNGFAGLLLQKAQCFSQRGWEGDGMAALRKSLRCLQISNNNKEAHKTLLRALVSIRQVDLAVQCSDLFTRKFGEDSNVREFNKLMEKGERLSKPEFGSMAWTEEKYERYCDYLDRFCGHYNCNTDIKEANWFGGRDEMIAGGSDCGSLFIWERQTQKILRLFKADQYSVNSVQCHPTSLLIATSGIDHVIRLWEPRTVKLFG